MCEKIPCEKDKGGGIVRVYLATKNPHKLEEVRMVAPSWIEILALPDKLPEAPETGETFLENALMKATWYMKFLRAPVIADDSGLEIDYLEGFPGVQSSRFMAGRSYREKMGVILRMLEGADDRRARFVCQAVYVEPGGVIVGSRGLVEGMIAHEIKGEKGFGYDPIFIPEGYEETFGQLGEEVKSRISHRSRAFKRLFEYLEKLKSAC